MARQHFNYQRENLPQDNPGLREHRGVQGLNPKALGRLVTAELKLCS